MGGLTLYSGALAQVPGQAGLSWLHLQFLLGLRRLGRDVLYLDRLAPEMCVDEAGNPTTVDGSVNLRYFLSVMDEFGLSDDFSLCCERGQQVIGLPREKVLERAREAACLINVMGYLENEDIFGAVKRRVFVDMIRAFRKCGGSWGCTMRSWAIPIL